ncbi:S41 family peptidase [Winogradskyella sp. PG-2]|uniref:S41 family peptidase n=1 Tax=Winogradskyella sp. PG-2 TaxID=754409 RepID=UPI0009FD7809|nr:S41 family peptidase [Winogradskyella sp. PG-2]
MKNIKALLLTSLVALTLTSCFEDLDDNAIAGADINDFVWKAMNAYYLYNANDNVPDLTNDRFGINGIDNRYEKTEEYSDYIEGFATPEDLFETLIFEPSDPFSAIVPNYLDILNQQEGTILSNGIEFRLYLVPGSSTEVFGAISLVLNNSVADDLGLLRGQIFRAVDGTNLTTDNINSLLSQNSYVLNFADYDNNGTPESADDIITLNGQSTDLTKVAYNENPVHLTKIINLTNTSVGYLMYNGFNSNFNSSLNDAFGQFSAAGVSELVIDLRYNGGGVIQTAANLGSMVTGQFTDQIFSKLFYNNNQLIQNRNFNFVNALEDNSAINSLNLSKVYVLTTSSSASASELLINSLRSYIEVIHIGDNTAGKTQANRLLFDSPDFSGNNVNSNHTYALIPLIANSTNVNDELVPANGLTPNITVIETPSTFGTLGEISEPLLLAAIADITSADRSSQSNLNDDTKLEEVKTPKLNSRIKELMFEE